jgi:hypothetical protein
LTIESDLYTSGSYFEFLTQNYNNSTITLKLTSYVSAYGRLLRRQEQPGHCPQFPRTPVKGYKSSDPVDSPQFPIISPSPHLIRELSLDVDAKSDVGAIGSDIQRRFADINPMLHYSLSSSSRVVIPTQSSADHRWMSMLRATEERLASTSSEDSRMSIQFSSVGSAVLSQPLFEQFSLLPISSSFVVVPVVESYACELY